MAPRCPSSRQDEDRDRDRRRSCRLGSFAYADTFGVLGREDIVRLGPSRICGGRGIFATRFIPAGTPITRYHGRVRRHVDHLPSDVLAYTFMCADERRHVVGAARPRKGNGLGQLANDAIHEEVTGLANNAEFLERSVDGPPRVYLVASRDIAAGDEILVDYHISYWMAFADDARIVRDDRLREWSSCHRRVQTALQKVFGSACCIDAYHGLIHSEAETTAVARYGVSVPRAVADARAQESAGCRCDKAHKRARLLDVRVQRAGDATLLAWRCAKCHGPTFELIDCAA